MAKTTRQTAVFGVEDWKRIYQTYREADFQSYDFETLRKSFVDYLRLYYPETFNDYIESSEFIALLDVMAFMGQALAFRTDLNTRENYLDTAERRDSVVKLANLVSYTPKRNTEASGYLKVFSVQTTENVIDYNGVNLANVTINWADPSNFDWQEQFTAIINASLTNSQQVGRPGARNTILGVRTDEYTINLVPGFLPVIPYTATVDGVNMPFEAVTSTAAGKSFIYEPAPLPNGQFNMLFRNDELGFASANTGYFFLFKQGVLQNQDFNLPERIANRAVNINIEGINNTDRWLYQLDNVGNITSEWQFVESVYAAAVEQLSPSIRDLFSVTSRTNDQITLNFGDGVFSTIPVGTFRCYVRASNGLQYIINPEEMQSVVIPISYVSRTGQIETITFTCGITTPVTNSQARETIDEIKQRAPARYYTQNRMVNGEDYNNFPFTAYNSIIKSKALNRASIGTSRYLDLLDNTGKYSSTNIFSSDGALYEFQNLPAFQFSWLTNNDISDIIINQITPTLVKDGAKQFYYAAYDVIVNGIDYRPSLISLDVRWNQSTTLANETTGYFKNSTGTPVSIGTYSSSNTKYIQIGSLVKFIPPAGYFFDATNRLVAGVPTRAEERLTLWASPTAVYNDGTNQGLGNFTNGQGPVVLNNFVPDGAICEEVIPLFVTDFTTTMIQLIAQQILLNRNFGLGYDNLNAEWYLITSTNLDVDAEFSLANAQSQDGVNNDASWFIQATTNGENYTVLSRSLDYYFGSVLETRFFFFSNQKIYDSRTGTVIQDFVKVLKTNSKPDDNTPLEGDTALRIIGQPVESDGFVDDFQVLVSYQDSDSDGVPDNPDFFNDIVAPSVDANHKLVFLQKTVDFDNLERYLLVDAGVVNSDYPTLDIIELYKSEYLNGQVFYAYNQDPTVQIDKQKFYLLTVTVNANGPFLDSTSVLTEVTNEWAARIGRQDLYFQYRHNSPLTSRLDPGTTNIIDLYVVTLQYYTAYQNWIKDSTGTVAEPDPPTIDQLTTDYSGLQDFKMISDNVIVNSVEFKPLFGAKAAEELRATIKVIRSAGSVASVSEIKNLVIANMDAYFSIDKWDFGATFYFSELAAYIHSQIGDIVSSVVLVPLNPQKSFGDLYEIRSAPNQIFVNGATLADVEVIQALTSTNLRTAPGSGVI
jgi:hypothetical protein